VVKRPLNRQWHEQHQLGNRTSLDERVRWYFEHAKVCSCRPIPTRVLEEIERRGIAAMGQIPSPSPSGDTALSVALSNNRIGAPESAGSRLNGASY
jgi:hypothetical protein